MSSRYAVIIMGCDEYADIAILNALFLERYWKNSGRKIYVTETQLPHDAVFDLEIATEKNMVWSNRLLKALECIEEEYVIMLCDDFFISETVLDEKIDDLIDVCIKNGLGCLKLMPAADRYEPINEQFGNSKTGTYRLSTMPAIWNAEYLKKIAGLNVSAWDFELRGSQYSTMLKEDVWCTRKIIIPFVHALNGGMWEYAAVRLFRRENIDKELYDKRKRKPLYKHIYRELGGFVYRSFPNLFQLIRKVVYREDIK